MNHLTSKQTPDNNNNKKRDLWSASEACGATYDQCLPVRLLVACFPKQTRREKLTAELRLHRAVKGRLIVTAAGQVTSLISCFTQKSNTFAPQELDTCDSNDNRHTGGRDARPKYQLLLAC